MGVVSHLKSLLFEDLLQLVKMLELGIELTQLHLYHHGHEPLNLPLLSLSQDLYQKDHV